MHTISLGPTMFLAMAAVALDSRAPREKSCERAERVNQVVALIQHTIPCVS